MTIAILIILFLAIAYFFGHLVTATQAAKNSTNQQLHISTIFTIQVILTVVGYNHVYKSLVADKFWAILQSAPVSRGCRVAISYLCMCLLHSSGALNTCINTQDLATMIREHCAVVLSKIYGLFSRLQFPRDLGCVKAFLKTTVPLSKNLRAREKRGTAKNDDGKNLIVTHWFLRSTPDIDR